MARIVYATLAANVAQDVTITIGDGSPIDGPRRVVEVVQISGTAPVYFSTTSSAPTVQGDDCQVVTPSLPVLEATVHTSAMSGTTATVKVISSAAAVVGVRSLATKGGLR